ncbi:MAG: DMT family transporter [Bacteroidetes bacterium]|nr:DMT family transporter [Bacteroidota bacterium]
MKIHNFRIYISALFAMLFWAFSFVWVKIVYEHNYRPITTIFLRLVISTILLYIVIKLIKKNQKIEKTDYVKFLILALFQPFFYFLGESFGLTLVSSTTAAVIVATIPVFSPIFNYFFVNEKISYLNFFGIIISFFGILLMVIKNFVFEEPITGVLLEFFAVASAIAYGIAIKKLSHKYSSFTIIKTQNLLGAIYFLPLFLINDFKQFITVKPDAELITALLMLAVFASSLAYILYIPVVRELGINRANMFTNLIPVFTAILSFFILAESFNFQKIMGMALVITGVSLTLIYRLINKISS